MIRNFSWHVKGIRSVEKRAILKNLFRDWRFDIICPQKTKLEEIDVLVARSVWSYGNLGFFFKGASRSSGPS